MCYFCRFFFLIRPLEFLDRLLFYSSLAEFGISLLDRHSSFISFDLSPQLIYD
jgi:hypothetical protein